MTTESIFDEYVKQQNDDAFASLLSETDRWAMDFIGQMQTRPTCKPRCKLCNGRGVVAITPPGSISPSYESCPRSVGRG